MQCKRSEVVREERVRRNNRRVKEGKYKYVNLPPEILKLEGRNGGTPVAPPKNGPIGKPFIPNE